MKFLSKLFLISILFFLVSCAATLPSAEKMQADVLNYTLPKAPEKDKAIVYVVRPSGGGGLIKFNVFIDDKEPNSEMGYTKGMEYIYFNLTPGSHTLLSKAENWAEQKVVVKEGDIVFIQQTDEIGIIMARNSLSTLQEIEGKYQVKSLTLGTVKKMDK